MKKLFIFFRNIIVIILLIVIANVTIPKNVIENNPFVVDDGELPMIAAHRGGGKNNPENTMLAFREAINTYGAEVIETDMYLTKDGYLVYNHDPYIDRTSNVNGDISYEEVKKIINDEEKRHYIEDMTLAELKTYNFGYYFKDENGERIYKDVTDIEGAGLQIATVEQLFDEFYETNPDIYFILEIKNSGERGIEAARILARTLENYPNYKDKVVVGSFHAEVELEFEEKFPHLYRGASTASVVMFVVSNYLGLGFLDGGTFSCLQIPMSYDLGVDIHLDTQHIVNAAHERGIAVQYWTINDEEDMRKLIELGSDCIMTDDPALMRQVIDSYKNK